MEAQQAFRFLTRYLLFLSLLVKLFGAPCGSPAKDLQMQGTFPLFSLAAPLSCGDCARYAFGTARCDPPPPWGFSLVN